MLYLTIPMSSLVDTWDLGWVWCAEVTNAWVDSRICCAGAVHAWMGTRVSIQSSITCYRLQNTWVSGTTGVANPLLANPLG